MHADTGNHAQSFLQLHTGERLRRRPSMGAWITYGLGTENQDLHSKKQPNPLSRLGKMLDLFGKKLKKIGNKLKMLENVWKMLDVFF